MYKRVIFSVLCCASGVQYIDSVMREMLERELLESQQPSLMVRHLLAQGQLNVSMPELVALVGVPQHAPWHPEGDAFEHTMQVLDAVAMRAYESKRDRLTFLYAALCHDLGKAVTTKLEDGVWRAHEHEIVGVPIARTMLERLGVDELMTAIVCKLTRHHMDPAQFIRHKEPPEMYQWLARELAGFVSLETLIEFSLCDLRGRGADGPLADETFPTIEAFRARARKEGILR